MSLPFQVTCPDGLVFAFQEATTAKGCATATRGVAAVVNAISKEKGMTAAVERR
jgi:hypothetical protein